MPPPLLPLLPREEGSDDVGIPRSRVVAGADAILQLVYGVRYQGHIHDEEILSRRRRRHRVGNGGGGGGSSSLHFFRRCDYTAASLIFMGYEGEKTRLRQ